MQGCWELLSIEKYYSLNKNIYGWTRIILAINCKNYVNAYACHNSCEKVCMTEMARISVFSCVVVCIFYLMQCLASMYRPFLFTVKCFFFFLSVACWILLLSIVFNYSLMSNSEIPLLGCSAQSLCRADAPGRRLTVSCWRRPPHRRDIN
jgi:hypothetical protein